MYTVSNAYYSSVLQYLERRGVHLTDTQMAVNRIWTKSNTDDQRVSLEYYEKLLCLGESLMSDSLLGFHLGQDIRTADFGVLGYLVESCSTLETALDALLRFDSLVADIGVAELLKEESTVHIRWTPKVDTNKHVILRNMTAWVATVRKLIRDSISPKQLTLTIALSPEEKSEIMAWFGCDVLVEQQNNALIFPENYLQLTFDSTNSELFTTLTHVSESQLSILTSSPSYASRVKQLLMVAPSLQNMELKSVASSFALTPRTLQRQLKDENTSFVHLLDEERKQRAKRFIANTSLLELSMLLGFSEQSALNKAFRRWFNQTPTAFKKRS